MKIKTDSMPFVTVIVPVYNAEDFIGKCLSALSEQDYPKDRHRIIVVDNGSKDNTRSIIRLFPEITLLVEHTIQSSYAARNRGIRDAKSDIYAFTDSDCIPEKDWISAASRFFMNNDADLVGGHVNFIYTDRFTAAEIYDSFVHMQNHSCIVERGVAKTANLFVKSVVFDTIGLFDSSLKSGGDVLFTKKATDNNFKLLYCKDSIVSHPTRRFVELIAKTLRTGYGKGLINRDIKMSKTVRQVIKQIVSPPNPFYWKKRVISEKIPASRFKIFRISLVMYITMVLSRFSELVGRFSVRNQ